MSNLYFIIGGDGKEYGPTTAEELHRWHLDGRVDARTRVRAEGTETWAALADVPDLATIVGPPPRNPSAESTTGRDRTSTGLPTEAELLARDYQLRVLDCLADGWTLLTRQFGPLMGASALVIGIFLVIALLGIIPFAGLLTTPASLILSGPLMGGVWHLFVRVHRGQRVSAGEVFDGFRLEFVSLMLVYLVFTLLATVAILPGMVPTFAGIFIGIQNGEPNALAIVLFVVGLVLAMAIGLICWALWGYAIELVMDRRIGFWAALELSRKVVQRHLLRNILLYVACALVLFLGYLLCLVGIFVAMPWVLATYARAYEVLFGPRPGAVAAA